MTDSAVDDIVDEGGGVASASVTMVDDVTETPANDSDLGNVTDAEETEHHVTAEEEIGRSPVVEALKVAEVETRGDETHDQGEDLVPSCTHELHLNHYRGG